MKLTVAICTYNPRVEVFRKVIQSLQRQTLSCQRWELLIIDNNSSNNFAAAIDLSWHPDSRIVLEKEQGLTPARIRSAKEARTSLMICVDDDNVLEPDYLEVALKFMQKNAGVGAMGGKALPVYERNPPEWFDETGIKLGCRNLGEQIWMSNYHGQLPQMYPENAPIGTGMVIRTEAFLAYVAEASESSLRIALGRKGASLASGEDNDMVLTLIKSGWEIAYVPDLCLDHLIPAGRLTPAYLSRMAYESNKSWVQVLAMHNINPWEPIPAWTLPLRKIKAYLRLKAWQNDLQYLKWKGACGMFEGRATLI